MSKTLPTWASASIVAVVALGTAAIIALLVQQNASLKAALATTRPSAVSAAGLPPLESEEDSLTVGDSIPTVEVINAAGERKNLREVLGTQGGVLVGLTPTCPFCQLTLPTWTKLNEDVSRRGFKLVGVSLHPVQLTSSYVNDHSINWEVWSLANAEGRQVLRIPTIPRTLVYGPDLQILELWRGALDARDLPALTASVTHHLEK